MAIQGSIAAVVLAAGRGTRAGGVVAKQFRMLGHRSVLGHAVAALADAAPLVVVVGPPGAEAEVRATLADAPSFAFVAGGATRRRSVAAALAWLAALPEPPTHVLIHDGARPFVPPDVLGRLLTALDGETAGAVPVLPVADTLVRTDGAVVPRGGLHRVQTPQGFGFAALVAAHAAWPDDAEATDDAQMLRAAGHAVALVPGDHRMEKITVPEDFARVAALNAVPPDIRTGTGFDVHALKADLPLWLAGVEVPHSHGLGGHSDADVAIHALVDAILGALAEGDIGQHFPPSDPQWRGAASSSFLAFAADRLVARGARLLNADVTIICEAPRVGPYRDAMRARLAEILRVDAGRVSVKATTTERLGFTGRREGIAAQATATILLDTR